MTTARKPKPNPHSDPAPFNPFSILRPRLAFLGLPDTFLSPSSSAPPEPVARRSEPTPPTQPSVLNPKRASELLEEVPEGIEWLSCPVLPTGVLALLVAYPKVGKTTFAYDLALAVSRGEPFLGFPTKQGVVLILVAEEKQDHALQRLRDYGLTKDDPVWVAGPSLHPSTPLYRELRQFIKENGVALVLIDSLTPFALLEDENDNSEVQRFMNPPLEIAHDTNAVILLIHHERKSGGEGGRNIRGGGAFLANADVALNLHTVQGSSTARRLEVLGRFQGYVPGDLRLEFKDGRYTSLGSEKDQATEAKKETLLSKLNTDFRNVGEVAEMVGSNVRSVRPILEALYHGGNLERAGRGVRSDPYTYRKKPGFVSSEPSKGVELGRNESD